MDAHRFDGLTRSLVSASSRRALLGVAVAGLLGASAAPDKKRNKGKNKKCAKAGQATSKKRKKCCQGLVRDGSGRCASAQIDACASCTATQLCLSGACQPCDVCPSGCPFSTVQAAVNAAAAGVTIRVCPGTYSGDLAINTNLTLIGAGDGSGAGSTIVRGSDVGTAVFVGGAAVVALAQLRITGGSDEGGAIFNNGTLSLTVCTISGNGNPAQFSGGIRNSGTLSLTGCAVSGNASEISGGGIANFGTLTMTGCLVTDNSAKFLGGGIFNDGGKVTLDAACRVTGNRADPNDPDSGGGIFILGGTVTLNGAVVSGNEPDDCGGAPVEGCGN